MTHSIPARRPGTGVQTGGASRPSRAASIADSLTSRQWDELTDIVMRRMERSVADERARRGWRINKGAL